MITTVFHIITIGDNTIAFGDRARIQIFGDCGQVVYIGNLLEG